MNFGPFNLGLVQRALREILGITIVFAGVLATISGLLAYALPRIQARFMQRQFIPPGVKQFRDAILGLDSTGAGVSEVAFAIAWSHPIVLALLSAHAIMVCTRVLAGEVERGTVDVLLALPVSRLRLLASETLAWLITAGVVLAAVYAGSYVGAQFIKPEFRPDWAKLFMVLCNLSLVYAVIGCAALLRRRVVVIHARPGDSLGAKRRETHDRSVGVRAVDCSCLTRSTQRSEDRTREHQMLMRGQSRRSIALHHPLTNVHRLPPLRPHRHANSRPIRSNRLRLRGPLRPPPRSGRTRLQPDHQHRRVDVRGLRIRHDQRLVLLGVTRAHQQLKKHAWRLLVVRIDRHEPVHANLPRRAIHSDVWKGRRPLRDRRRWLR